MSGKFQVYEDRSGRWRWRLKTSYGQVIATGEAFMTKRMALKGVESVQRAADGAQIVEVDG